jgi:NAD(P)H-hydrate epimerase
VYVLSAAQIKAWDAYTIKHELITSVDLMERAARACVDWIEKHCRQKVLNIFCGKGNNGGDGLAIARLLLQRKKTVKVYILEIGKEGTTDFRINLERLQALSESVHFLQDEAQIPKMEKDEVVIDALFGTGLNTSLTGLAAALTRHINQSGVLAISIDLPSGMFADQSSKGNAIIKADHTLTFQCIKLALLVQENGPFTGQVHLLDIMLHPGFLEDQQFTKQLIDTSLVKKIYRPRYAFAHKGTYGHALLIGGSHGKMGAAVLATKACVHTGAGLTSVCIPSCGYNIMQTCVPEAMVLTDENERWLTQLPAEPDQYAAIGIGPGIGTEEATMKLLSYICKRYEKPMVIDADGLNCIAINKDLFTQLPPFSVLTPHPKEFDRLFGLHETDFERLQTAVDAAAKFKIIIVLKGHHTIITTPGGLQFFNTTGNAGMAKGGSGDVLTGIITSLLAQGYQPVYAALLGVWIHGSAGDSAAAHFSMETITSSDIINHLYLPFQLLNKRGTE